MNNPLTVKQEAYAQAFIKLGDKSAAYREAYKSSNMKPETINRKAFEVHENGNVSARIDELRSLLANRNEIEIDELVKALAGMVRFDVGELYDEHGQLKNIHEMSLTARQMITQLDTFEQHDHKGAFIGTTKKIRTIGKLDAIEKLMKHLGGYEKDNRQKTPEVKTVIKIGYGKKDDGA